MIIDNEWTAKIASLEAQKEALEIIIQATIESTGADIPYGALPGEIESLRQQIENLEQQTTSYLRQAREANEELAKERAKREAAERKASEALTTPGLSATELSKQQEP